MNKTITGIILAAGSSNRYGKGNKILEKINNKEVLLYSLEVFVNNNFIDNIVITVKKEDYELIDRIIKKNNYNKEISIVIGGNSRKESVYNAIKSIDSDVVVIHDAARPLIKDSYINECINNIKKYKGVSIGVKAKDTIKIVDSNNIVVNTTSRDNTYLIQTPQCFDRKLLLELHKKYENESVTDDCMLLEKDGYDIKVIDGDYSNIKITYYDDLNIVKYYIDNM